MNKKLIAPILSICAFLGLGVGSTYALFTSNANTDIQIKAGKVSISSALSGLKTYSVTPDDDGTITDEFGKKYSQPETAVAGEFTNGGTAALSDGKVELKLVSPGDKVEFNYSISNASTIQVKYRYTIKCASSLPEDIEFFSKLKFVVDGEDFTGISKYVTEWRSSSTAEKVEDLDISVEVPTTLMSEFGARNCAIEIYAEAVQANAYVTDDEAGKTFVKAAVSKDITLETGDVTIKSEDNAYSTVVKAADIEALQESIPAPTATNTYGLELGLVINELEASSELEKNLDIDLKATLYKYDVEGNVEETTTSKPTLTDWAVATVNIGTDLVDVKATHNGNAMVNSADTADDQGNGVYTYDSASGVLTIKTKTFSPFGVTYMKGYWENKAAQAYHSEDASAKVIEIATAEELALLAKKVNAGTKYTGYKINLLNDIDLTGYYWNPIGNSDAAFIGEFNGGNHTVKGMNICKTGERIGFIGEMFTGDIKNINVIGEINSNGSRVGGILGHGYATITNCSFTGNINSARYQVGGIAGYLCGEVIDCTVNAKITAISWCGGVVGSLVTDNTASIKNCIANVTISATGSYYGPGVGALVGVCLAYSDEALLIKGNTINSEVYWKGEKLNSPIGYYNCDDDGTGTSYIGNHDFSKIYVENTWNDFFEESFDVYEFDSDDSIVGEKLATISNYIAE